MCGIVGFVHFDKERNCDKNLLKEMANLLVHRGPDGEGYFTERNVGLGHRRLAIIDLNSGQQPMYSEDGNVIIVFNGEIYNYVELRDELRDIGYRFRTNSDTEVILIAYEQWGTDCVNKFNGMWAFALWDRRRRRLFCSRDRLGEKPFFYAVYEDSFVFASEIKALFAYGVPKHVNDEMLDIYLSLTYIPAPFTFFKGIHKLNPGHSVIIDGERVHITRYWDIKFLPESEARRDEDRIFEEFSDMFHDSVRIRMRSDVPYGAFLSGGLDSGSVVSAMSRAVVDPIKTFTVGFEEDDFDERKLASLIASQFGTDHRVRVVSMGDVVELMEKLAWHYDEPFGDSSAIPTYLISQAARQEVKVALTGDGGDEILSGYTIVQGEKFSEQINSVPQIMRKSVARLLSQVESMSPAFSAEEITAARARPGGCES